MKPDLKLFQKLTAFPFALIFVAFLFPLVNVSCSGTEIPIAEPNAYSLLVQKTPESFLSEDYAVKIEEMKSNAPEMRTFLEQPLGQIKTVVLPIFLSVALAAVFALFSPLASLAMGLAAFVSLWVFVYRLSVTVHTEHYDFLTVEPGVGTYCATFLLAIGVAMNLTVLIKTWRAKRRQQKKELTPSHLQNSK